MHCADILTNDAKGMVGKTYSASAGIKAVVSRRLLPVFFPITHSQLFKKPVSLKNDLDEAVKIINFVKSQSLALNLFNLQCDTMGSTRGALLSHTEARQSPLGKTHLCMFEL